VLVTVLKQGTDDLSQRRRGVDGDVVELAVELERNSCVRG
jgi:hypothetical protein